MGNVSSDLLSHLYVLRMTNDDLPLIPFLHTIVSYNDKPIDKTDPRTFKSILATSNLVLEIRDVRNSSRFRIEVPRGTEKLGINVIRMQGNVRPLHIKVTNVREGCPFALEDHILGVENVYIENENEFVRYVKENKNKEVVFIVARRGTVIRVQVTLTGELGCEISTGLLHKLGTEDELYMEGYNGRIKRQRADSQTADYRKEENVEARSDEADTREEKKPLSASQEEKKAASSVTTMSEEEAAVKEESKKGASDLSVFEEKEKSESEALGNINCESSSHDCIKNTGTSTLVPCETEEKGAAKEEQACLFDISRYEAGSYGAHFCEPSGNGAVPSSNEYPISAAFLNYFQKLNTSDSKTNDVTASGSTVYADKQYQSIVDVETNNLAQDQYYGTREKYYDSDGQEAATLNYFVQEPDQVNTEVAGVIAGCNDYLRGQHSLNSPAAVILENRIVPESSLVTNEVGVQVLKEAFDDPYHNDDINGPFGTSEVDGTRVISPDIVAEGSTGEDKGTFESTISSTQLIFSDEYEPDGYNGRGSIFEQEIGFDEPELSIERFGEGIEIGERLDNGFDGEDLSAYLFSQEGTGEKDSQKGAQGAVIDFEEGDDFVFDCKEHH